MHILNFIESFYTRFPVSRFCVQFFPIEEGGEGEVALIFGSVRSDNRDQFSEVRTVMNIYAGVMQGRLKITTGKQLKIIL